MVNNKPLRTAEDCEFVLNSIDLQIQEKIYLLWDELIRKWNVKFKI